MDTLPSRKKGEIVLHKRVNEAKEALQQRKQRLQKLRDLNDERLRIQALVVKEMQTKSLIEEQADLAESFISGCLVEKPTRQMLLCN
jgi:anaerobic ribonucleoside-triphosphate reductase